MGRRTRAISVLFAIPIALLALTLWSFGHTTYAQDTGRRTTAETSDPALGMGPWRVGFADAADLAALAGRYDVWSVDHLSNTALIALTNAEVEALRRSGRNMTFDLALAARVNPPITNAAIHGSAGFTCYRTLSETQISMQQLALDYPNLVRMVDIGDSWDKVTPGEPGGHDLEALVLTNRQKPGPKFRMMLIGAIHARELATAESAMRFAEELARTYGTDPDATWLLDYGELHVVPVANPDGREIADQGLLWRKNTHDAELCSWPYYGVDLNRNAPFQWNSCAFDGQCSDSDPCDQTYRGDAPGSEPETQALMAYAAGLFPDQRGDAITDTAPARTSGLFMSLHSYGRLVLYPWAHTPTPPPNAAAMDILARRFGYYTGYTACQLGANGCLYLADGTLDDWIYGELGIAAYTFEMGDYFFEQCSSYESSIAPDVRDALGYALKAARRPYQTPRGPEVTTLVATPSVVSVGNAFRLSATIDDSRINPPFQLAAPASVLGARYTIDAPSWLTTTVPFSDTATITGSGPTTVQTSISTTGWEVGRHLVLVEGTNGGGRWGVPTGVFVEVVSGTITTTTESLYFPVIGSGP